MRLLPDHATWKTIRLGTVAGMVLIHMGAVAALWHFSWTGLIMAAVLYYVTGAWGITLCFHRMLTHGSFKCSRPLRYLLTVCGILACQGAPVTWVSHHRLHHKESDHEPDPHSPVIVNFLWAHVLWTFWPDPSLPDRQAEFNYARDLMRDRWFVMLDRTSLALNIVAGALLVGTGWAIAGPGFGLSLFLWGFCLRIAAVWHSTWLVNSATHLWGYCNYSTVDNSRNTWWVALLTFGEGWHNNHHADQRSAAHGHRWFEIDVTYWTIRTLEMLGLARDVVKPDRKGKTALSKAA